MLNGPFNACMRDMVHRLKLIKMPCDVPSLLAVSIAACDRVYSKYDKMLDWMGEQLRHAMMPLRQFEDVPANQLRALGRLCDMGNQVAQNVILHEACATGKVLREVLSIAMANQDPRNKTNVSAKEHYRRSHGGNLHC